MNTLRAWLNQHGFAKYAEVFAENDISLGILPDLTDADLEKLGVSLGNRKKLLRAIAELPPEPVAPARSTTPERRQVTVLFCDLVGSTTLSSRLDPEDYRVLIQAYQVACGAVVRDLGGHVAKFLGDGLLACFGYPQAHEDAAARAVHAGLRLVAKASSLPPGGGEPLRIRVGISTGLVVVGELLHDADAEEDAVLGETPNLAARLQAEAAPGTVIVGAVTRRLAGRAFDYDYLGGLRLKGIDEPVPAWRVAGEAATDGRFAERHSTELTALVGRVNEVELLLDRWQQVKVGEGQVVHLSGEAGIGKSRIVQALRDRLTGEDHTAVLYQCSPYHVNSALYPVVRQVQVAAGITSDDDAGAKLAKIEQLFSDAPDREQVVPLIAQRASIPLGRYRLPQTSPQVLRELTLAALAAHLLGLSATHPLLLILEDAHWLDPTTGELINLLVDQSQRAPVIVVVTFRPGFVAPWSAFANITSLTLNRLTRRQCEQMLHGLTARRPLPSEVAEQIVTRCDGVPLYLEELTKAVVERAWLSETDDRYALTEALPERAIPASIQDSLMARLDHLPPAARELAQIGAAIGREFSENLVAAVSPLDQQAFAAAVYDLVASGLVHQRGGMGDASYVFKHALIQDAAYECILKRNRPALHSRIVAAIERDLPNAAMAAPEALAHHVTEAGEVERAIGLWQQAAERAMQQWATAEAIAHLRRGIGLLSGLPETEAHRRAELDMQLTLGQALRAVEGSSAAVTGATFERARTLCEELGETTALARVLYGTAVFHFNVPRLTPMAVAAVDLLRLGRRLADPGVMAVGHQAAGLVRFARGRIAMARSHLAAAASAPGLDAHRQRFAETQYPFAAIVYLGWTMAILGWPEQALRDCRNGLATLGTVTPFTRVMALSNACVLFRICRADEEFRKHAVEAWRIASEERIPMYSAITSTFNGWVRARDGDAAGATMARNGISYAVDRRQCLELPFKLAILADAHRMHGQLEPAGSAIAEALARVDATDERWCEAELKRLDGELRLAAAKGGAEACFVEALRLARSQRAKLWELRAATALARLWHGRGEAAAAFDLLAPVYDWFTEGFAMPDLMEAKALLDELAT